MYAHFMAKLGAKCSDRLMIDFPPLGLGPVTLADAIGVFHFPPVY